jgi:hypothetical protein
VYSACRCDGRREQRGSAALVTIAHRPGRARITDIKRQRLSPPNARRDPGRTPAATPAGRCRTLPDALDPGFHCARTRWIRDFTAFQLVLAPELVVL